MPLVWGRAFFLFSPEIRLFVLRDHLSRAAALPGADVFFQTSDCFKNITSTISKHALSESLGARFAEQNVGNPKKTSALSGFLVLLCAEQNVGNLTHALSGILGLLCAEQDVGNLKQMHL